jgi:hypothetical protein
MEMPLAVAGDPDVGSNPHGLTRILEKGVRNGASQVFRYRLLHGPAPNPENTSTVNAGPNRSLVVFEQRQSQGTGRKEASKVLLRVHLVASLLKRWLTGTHQGAVSHQHLPYYLDEFTFRFNRRRSKSRGKLFFGLVQQAAATGPMTY